MIENQAVVDPGFPTPTNKRVAPTLIFAEVDACNFKAILMNPRGMLDLLNFVQIHAPLD